VLVAVGLLTLVVGAVLTAIYVNDNNTENKYPKAFSIVGPLLIVLGIILTMTGFILSTPAVSSALLNCFNCDDPNGFCRKKFPRLSHFLRPDETVFFNKSAMEALQNQPAKSALKRPQPPEGYERSRHESQGSDSVFITPPAESHTKTSSQSDAKRTAVERVRMTSKGVRFSDSDPEAVRDVRAASFTSATSAVSLKHCKIHPKSDIFWVDHQKTAVGNLASVDTTTEL